MDNSLSTHDQEGIQHHLDRAEVIQAVVEQLRKDLALAEGEIPFPEVSNDTFAVLSAHVLPVLESLESSGAYALQVAMYRVDIPEAHLQRTLAHGGVTMLADEVVLRALQKVLTRLRYAGRF